jgi:hypothetical protein
MSDFKDMIIKDVVFQHPKLNSPYIFDPMQRKSFQSTEDTPKSFWSCGFKLNKKEATELWNAAKDHYNECKARDSKLGKFKTIHSYKENEDDTISFSAKKNCKTAKGKPNSPIRVVDGNKKPLEDLGFWTGSTGSIKFSMHPTLNPSKNEWGISFLLDAVQVVNAEYSSMGDDFDEVETKGDTIKPDETPESVIFGEQEATVGGNASQDFDDEIPF